VTLQEVLRQYNLGTLPGAYNPHICEVTRSGAGRAGGLGLHQGGGWRGEIAGVPDHLDRHPCPAGTPV